MNKTLINRLEKSASLLRNKQDCCDPQWTLETANFCQEMANLVRQADHELTDDEISQIGKTYIAVLFPK